MNARIDDIVSTLKTYSLEKNIKINTINFNFICFFITFIVIFDICSLRLGVTNKQN